MEWTGSYAQLFYPATVLGTWPIELRAVRLYTGDYHRGLGLPQQTTIVTNATVTVALETLSLATILTINIEQNSSR